MHMISIETLVNLLPLPLWSPTLPKYAEGLTLTESESRSCHEG